MENMRFVSLFGCEALVAGKSTVAFECHTFPDGELCFRVNQDVSGLSISIYAQLDRPTDKVLSLVLLAEALRDQGAKDIRLVAPYLPYMRQDKSFHPGEAVSSRHFAKLISHHFDSLVTVDPHLHRYDSLDEIYSIPSQVLHANPVIADWIQQNVENPVLVGPDAESEQWVSEVAKLSNAPFFVLEKDRHSDVDVDVTAPAELQKFVSCTPVLVDDIISSGQTMIQTQRMLQQMGFKPAIAIGVHAIFSGNAYADMQAAGFDKIVTCNAISHLSNQIDLTKFIQQTIF